MKRESITIAFVVTALMGTVDAASSWGVKFKVRRIGCVRTEACAVADFNGDDTPEQITGKRFRAHNGGDPDEDGPLGVYYYEFTPGPNPVFTKHAITYNEGIGAGMNIVPVDIDGDGDVDLVTTGKWGGPVIFENMTKNPAGGSPFLSHDGK